MATTPHSTPAGAIYIGRQPIYDRDLNVVAYELLYRKSEQDNWADVTDGEHATTHVLNNAFMEIGFDALVGEYKAFINMPRGYIVSEQLLSLPPERVVLELLEDIAVDDEVVAAVQRLSQQGYIIALDDFVFHEKLVPLVQLADIIKIDLKVLSSESLVEHVKQLKQGDVRLLAEKVETQEEFDNCRQLGFDYFQGYFFSRPQIISSDKLPTNRLSILQLIARIYDPEVSFDELDRLISQDVTLSFKLLRVINSAAYALPRKIESMKQAVTILGIKNIRNWISMISFSGVDDKPSELFRSSMIRAKMCENLALALGVRDSDSCFTIGLFSNLDAIMDQPLTVLIMPLPLSTEIKQALLEREGMMGKTLNCVLAYEQGDWEKVVLDGLSPQQIRQAYAESLHWEHDISKEIV